MLHLTAVAIAPDGVVADLQTTATIIDCPTCQMPTQRVHSYYQRRLADLPLAQVPVQLHLHVRRFRCDNLSCPRTTFSEPVPELIRPYARRTTRQWAEHRQIGLDSGERGHLALSGASEPRWRERHAALPRHR
ncbi:transposase family protein [Chloroflexales bacterium ZM16-3]|nr:transposase family protein [Chloroflexales bacterium ZM16-3]